MIHGEQSVDGCGIVIDTGCPESTEQCDWSRKRKMVCTDDTKNATDIVCANGCDNSVIAEMTQSMPLVAQRMPLTQGADNVPIEIVLPDPDPESESLVYTCRQGIRDPEIPVIISERVSSCSHLDDFDKDVVSDESSVDEDDSPFDVSKYTKIQEHIQKLDTEVISVSSIVKDVVHSEVKRPIKRVDYPVGLVWASIDTNQPIEIRLTHLLLRRARTARGGDLTPGHDLRPQYHYMASMCQLAPSDVIRKIIDFVFDDPFWRTKVDSVYKFQKSFEAIKKAYAEKGGRMK